MRGSGSETVRWRGRTSLGGAAALASIGLALISCGDDAASASSPAGTTGKAPWAQIATGDAQPSTPSGRAQIAFRGDGSSVAWWRVGDGGKQKPFSTVLVPRAADGAVGSATVLKRTLADDPKARPDGAFDVLDVVRADTWELSKLETRTITAQGTWGPGKSLTSAARITAASLDVAANGSAVAAWAESADATDQELGDWAEGYNVRIRAAVRPAGATQFGKPRTLYRGLGLPTRDGGVSASINDAGQTAVAYAEYSYARDRGWDVRVLNGTLAGGFGASIPLGEHTTDTQVRSVFTSSGRVVVAWGTIAHGEEVHSNWSIHAASVARGAARASKSQLVDPGHGEYYADPEIALAAGPDGATTLAYSRLQSKVRIARSSQSGRFGKPTALTHGIAVGGLAVRADGATVLTVGDSDGDNSEGDGASYAFIRPAGAAAFGPAELLGVPVGSEGFDVSFGPGMAPVPAFDPTTGQPVVAWTVSASGGAPAELAVQTRDRP